MKPSLTVSHSWVLGQLLLAVGLLGPFTRPAELRAQQSRALLDASAGTASDERGVRASAVSLAPALVFAASPSTVLTVHANGTTFGAGRWVMGAGLGLSTHSRNARHFGLGLDAGAAGALSSYHTRIGAVSAAPVAELDVGTIRLYAGAQGALSVTLDSPVQTQSLPGAPAARQTRAVIGPLFGGELQVHDLRLAYREVRERVAGVTSTDRTLTLDHRWTLLQWNAGIGMRSSEGTRTTFGMAALRIPIIPALALTGSAAWYPANRVLGTEGGRSLRVGMQLGFAGGQPRPVKRFRAEGAPAPAPGYTRLLMHAPDAHHVEVAGDWNKWIPATATRAANGVWYADVALTPGTYRYGFRVDGRWEVPEDAVTVDDGYGGHSAVVQITSSQGE